MPNEYVKALRHAEQIAYSSKEVLRFTYDKAKELIDLPGVYVECGVAAGAQLIAMAAATEGQKDIYGFDSFQGIPLPSNKDDQYPGIRKISEEEQSKLPNPGEQELVSSGAVAVSADEVRMQLIRAGVDFSRVNLIEGWFEETVWNFNEPISILRLDGDLYNSTYTCLEHLYPKVIPGGLVIIDDIQLSGCEAAVTDYFNFINQTLPGRSWNGNTVYWYK